MMEVRISNAEDGLFERGLYRVSIDVAEEHVDDVLDLFKVLLDRIGE